MSNPEKHFDGDAGDRLKELNTLASQQRATLIDRMDLARERTRPARVAHDARNKLLDATLNLMNRGKAAAREHPAKAIGIAMAAGAVLARRPLLRLLATGWSAGIRRFRRDESATNTEEGAE